MQTGTTYAVAVDAMEAVQKYLAATNKLHKSQRCRSSCARGGKWKEDWDGGKSKDHWDGGKWEDESDHASENDYVTCMTVQRI